ncbi:hypothetical protein OUZ56_003874 [Daphnia magna]|uniref:Uncharacterized protein n=1 Tax=Daphnia magna TaxID=35525 RepID=A0ABQ9YN13_9CRUS|nr:hypothetical protein OUZ56_003874 [Daphnia magna]
MNSLQSNITSQSSAFFPSQSLSSSSSIIHLFTQEPSTTPQQPPETDSSLKLFISSIRSFGGE